MHSLCICIVVMCYFVIVFICCMIIAIAGESAAYHVHGACVTWNIQSC